VKFGEYKIKRHEGGHILDLRSTNTKPTALTFWSIQNFIGTIKVKVNPITGLDRY
jgi:hypothetical protein